METVTLEISNLLSFSQAAAELGVSRPTIYNLIKRYNLRPLQIGNNKYLFRHEVEALRVKLQSLTKE